MNTSKRLQYVLYSLRRERYYKSNRDYHFSIDPTNHATIEFLPYNDPSPYLFPLQPFKDLQLEIDQRNQQRITRILLNNSPIALEPQPTPILWVRDKSTRNISGIRLQRGSWHDEETKDFPLEVLPKRFHWVWSAKATPFVGVRPRRRGWRGWLAWAKRADPNSSHGTRPRPSPLSPTACYPLKITSGCLVWRHRRSNSTIPPTPSTVSTILRSDESTINSVASFASREIWISDGI